MTIQDFLDADELDDLAGRQAMLPRLGPDDVGMIEAVIGRWTDLQAIANLMMYPGILPPGIRGPALLRALAPTAHGYLNLAAAVGVGRLSAGDLAPEIRAEVVESLLDLIAGDAGTIALSAAASLGAVAERADAVELVVLLGHPTVSVRHNVRLALLGLVGIEGMQRLLEDRGAVSAEDARRANDALAADGVDLTRGPEGSAALMLLAYLPNLSEWDAA